MKPNPNPIPSKKQELITQKQELQSWLAINTVNYGEAGEAYLCLWHYMILATELHGFVFDKSFKEKVIPEEHWRNYVEKFVKFYKESSSLEQVPWDNSSQLLEIQEKMNRMAWRCWQCFESLESTLLSTSTIVEFVSNCLSDQDVLMPSKRKVRRVKKLDVTDASNAAV